MKKTTLILILSAVILAAIYYFFRSGVFVPLGSEQNQMAVSLAKERYAQAKARGTNLSDGPCIAEDLMPDWVADIAHNPRHNLDNLPENQCGNFRNGKAHHFVELDPDGNVIRVQ